MRRKFITKSKSKLVNDDAEERKKGNLPIFGILVRIMKIGEIVGRKKLVEMKFS